MVLSMQRRRLMVSFVEGRLMIGQLFGRRLSSWFSAIAWAIE
jgi:hypothetical protein